MPPGSNGAMRGRIVGGRGRVKGSESAPLTYTKPMLLPAVTS